MKGYDKTACVADVQSDFSIAVDIWGGSKNILWRTDILVSRSRPAQGILKDGISETVIVSD